MTQPTVIVIGAGRWQVPLIETCRTLGLRTIAVDADPDAPGFLKADLAINLSAHASLPVIAAVEELKESWSPIVGVVTKAVRGAIVTTALLAERLRVPGIPPATAALTVDRLQFRDFLTRRGLGDIHFARAADHLEQTANELGWPLVVKPASDSSGSVGIGFADTPVELIAAVERARQAVPGVPVILEEYVHGTDLAVLGLVAGGRFHVLGMVQRRVIGAPHFLPDRYWCPWNELDPRRESILSYVSSLVEALPITVGPVHIELRVSDNGRAPQTIEVEPSLPAHTSERLIPQATGQDILSLAVRAWLGEPVIPEPRFNRYSGCQYIYAPEAGQIRAIHIRDNTVDRPGNVEFVWLKGAGDVVENRSAADAIAIVYATGDSREAVDAALDISQDRVVVEMP